MQAQQIHRIGFDPKSNTERVSVFARRLKTHSVYYARYTIESPELANNQRHLTESLKTDNLEVALERARQRYSDIRHKEEARLALKPLLVEDGIDKFIKQYETGVNAGANGYSKHMLRGYHKTVGNYWKPYIGTKSLNAVTVDDIQDYEIWRRQYATDPTRKQHARNKATVSSRTLQWEINAFKSVLRWCAQRGMYVGRAYEWKFKVGYKVTRSAFTLEQYRKLYRYMRTKEFMQVGKHGTDARIQRHRHMMRAYILFMCNTGLRPGEARNLQWRDVGVRTNNRGQEVLTVNVLATHSKVKKQRTVIGRTTAHKALSRYRKILQDSGEIAEDSYIFCNEKGKPYHDMREGFKAILKEAGVALDREGREHPIYACRHTYITFRIMFARNLDIFKLAENCGTGISMIQIYYNSARSEDFINALS